MYQKVPGSNPPGTQLDLGVLPRKKALMSKGSGYHWVNEAVPKRGQLNKGIGNVVKKKG